ncbi:hypothetical protein COLO4_32162 [Corchorus olitorius]|uniref:Uncharacterized protein n=1 Tax=Corchorus olitorius TaxID=93759 RepID=A0A1R3H122_9ROSI|nr:hypothetical protein COLO4_32162 [Corchorus olitorius]
MATVSPTQPPETPYTGTLESQNHLQASLLFKRSCSS